jgi:hypothetical protein
VHWLERLSIGAVEAMAAVAAHPDQAHAAKNAEVLRDRWLIEADGNYDLADVAFIRGQEGEDLAAAGLCDGVEGIGGGSGACHEQNNTYLYGNMSRKLFFLFLGQACGRSINALIDAGCRGARAGVCSPA